MVLLQKIFFVLGTAFSTLCYVTMYLVKHYKMFTRVAVIESFYETQRDRDEGAN